MVLALVKMTKKYFFRILIQNKSLFIKKRMTINNEINHSMIFTFLEKQMNDQYKKLVYFLSLIQFEKRKFIAIFY
jgi:hypothetical protein